MIRLATLSLITPAESTTIIMDSHQISSVLKRDRFTKHDFRGVFACDQLPKQYVPRPSALVVNTDPSTQPGEHWVAIYITRDGEGEYFDSYGQSVMLPEIRTFLRKNTTRTCSNSRPLQGPWSAVCGQYCIFFLLNRCRGLTMTKIVNLFSWDKNDNDVQVDEFIKRHFPKLKSSVFDEQFVTKQIARALAG